MIHLRSHERWPPGGAFGVINRLLRCSWEAVDGVVGRVVADQLDDARLEEVYRIGVDGVSG